MEAPFSGKNPSALTKTYTINLHYCKGLKKKKKVQGSIKMPSKQSSLKLLGATLVLGVNAVNKNKNRGEREMLYKEL